MDMEIEQNLHYACKIFDVETVEQLLRAHPDVSRIKQDMYGYTPLHYASCGSLELVQILLSYNDVIGAINCVNLAGETSFYTSAVHGHVDIAELLLHYGSDPTICNKEGCSSLQYAQTHHLDSITSFFLACQNMWIHGEWYPWNNEMDDLIQSIDKMDLSL